MLRLADPLGSFAVLIGTSAYERLPRLDPVSNNLTRLRALVTDDDVWGLPGNRCVVVPNPSSVEQFMGPITHAIERATDAVLIYYAGHGLLHPVTSSLRLALTGSDLERTYSSIPFDYIHEALRRRINLNKFVLLDCCYSGGAYPMDGKPVRLGNDHIQVDSGTYAMTASGETNAAMCYPDEQYSAFTGELIEVIESGLAVDDEFLELRDLYQEVKVRLAAKDRPRPQQRDSGTMVTFVRNRRYLRRKPALPVGNGDGNGGKVVVSGGGKGSGGGGKGGGGAAQLATPPAVPEQYVSIVRSVPRHVLAEAARMGPAQAEEMLSTVGTHTVAQGVAALLEILVREQRPRETEFVIRGAALRSPADLATIATVLSELGLPEPGRRLFEKTTRGLRRPHELAAIAVVLKSSPIPLYDVNAFLSDGLRGASGPQEMVDLIEALWLAGLDDEAREMTALTAELLAPQEASALADRLRADGYDRTAFNLYRRALAAVAVRSAQEVAEFVVDMRVAHQADIADGLLAVVADRLSAAADAVELLPYLDALAARGRANEIGQLTVLIADRLALPEAIRISDQLRGFGQEDPADAIMVHHALRKPDCDIVALLRALHAVGRPMVAFTILRLIGEHHDPPLLPAVVTALHRHGLGDDEQRVLKALASHPTAQVRVPEALAQAYRVNDRYFPMTVMRFLAEHRSVADLVNVVGDLGTFRERAFVDALMALPTEADTAAFFDGDLRLDPARVLAIAAEDLPEAMLRLLTVVRRHQPESAPWLLESAASLPLATLTDLVEIVGRAMPAGEELSVLLQSCARLSVQNAVAVVMHLDRQGQAELGGRLVESWLEGEGQGIGGRLLMLMLERRGLTDPAYNRKVPLARTARSGRQDARHITRSIRDHIKSRRKYFAGAASEFAIRDEQVPPAVLRHTGTADLLLLIEFRWMALRRGFLSLTHLGLTYYRSGEEVHRMGYEKFLTLDISLLANNTVGIGDLHIPMQDAFGATGKQIVGLLNEIKQILRTGVRTAIAEPAEGFALPSFPGAAAPSGIRDQMPIRRRRR